MNVLTAMVVVIVVVVVLVVERGILLYCWFDVPYSTNDVMENVNPNIT